MNWSDKNSCLVTALCCVLVASEAVCASPPPQFVANAMHLPPDLFYSAVGSVSEDSQIYGVLDFYAPSLPHWMARFDAAGQLAWHGETQGDRPNFFSSEVTKEGVFIGQFDNPVGSASSSNAATFTESGGLRTWPSVPDSQSVYVRGASPNGQWLTGEQNFWNAPTQGIVWTPDDGYLLTGTFYGHDVARNGTVVGTDAATGRAAEWTKASGMKLLPELPIDYGSATGFEVTESGLILVRASIDPSNPDRLGLFVYDGKRYTRLESTAGDYADATAINDAGWVVGFDRNGPLLWIDGAVHDLEPLIVGLPQNVTTWYARAINNRGQIGIEGTDGTFLFFNEPAPYTLLLTPIAPEPTAFAMLSGALFALRRRRPSST